MSRKEDLIVGLDIGTTKICVIVATRTENGVDVVGIGTHPSRGLRKGCLLYTSPSPRDKRQSRMPSSA